MPCVQQYIHCAGACAIDYCQIGGSVAIEVAHDEPGRVISRRVGEGTGECAIAIAQEHPHYRPERNIESQVSEIGFAVAIEVGHDKLLGSFSRGAAHKTL